MTTEMLKSVEERQQNKQNPISIIDTPRFALKRNSSLLLLNKVLKGKHWI